MTHDRTKHFGFAKRHSTDDPTSPLASNEMLARLIAAFGGGVDGLALSPPVRREEDDMYLVNGVGSGEWAGQDETIATWFRAAWIFTPLVAGSFIHDRSTRILHRYIGPGLGFVESSALVDTKGYGFTTQGVGVGTFYPDGWYESDDARAALTQASASQVFGTANVGYGAHAFAVSGPTGVVDTGVVGLQVSGKSVTDEGVVVGSDTELIIPDITATSLNDYFETPKKWVGQVTFSLVVISGSPTAYSLNINYGLAKYEDFQNREFTITTFEATVFAGSNDAGYNIELLHHKSEGWTYSVASFVPGSDVLASLLDTYGDDHQLSNNEYSAFKRTEIDTLVAGDKAEGTIVRLTTTQPNAIEELNVNVTGRMH